MLSIVLTAVSQINTIKAFNSSRKIQNPATICYAAEVSLNFDQTGNVTACCFNRSFVLGKYPQDSISSIWSGKRIQQLRKSLKNNSLALGCEQCSVLLLHGNYEGALITQFDNFVPRDEKNWSKALKPQKLPALFEFEISNTCNLECIMCGGKWSSAIRKNRENLPAIKSPYDEEFVADVKKFIPTLRRANFLGGEPFLISLYYDIWESIISLNPEMEVAITSNGTTLSKRARTIIENLNNLKITFSIDSLQKECYESIRRNADYSVVMENMNFLLEKGKIASLSVCPMIQNRHEIPEIIQFCLQNDIDIFFNVVNEPLGGRKQGIHSNSKLDEPGEKSANSHNELLPETSLKYLSETEMSETIEQYKKYRISHLEPNMNGLTEEEKESIKHKLRRYQNPLDGLINQLTAWMSERKTDIPQPMEAERDYTKYKNSVMQAITISDQWELVKTRIVEVEQLVKDQNKSTYEFYRQLKAAPTDAIIRSCVDHNSDELYEMYLLSQQ